MNATLKLIGPVCVLAADGTDLTPRGQKARGALALLGTAHGLRMTRAQLQDKLWSEAEPRNGADSLRQMIRELRGQLGDLLLAGPGWVGLDPARLAVDLTPVSAPGQPQVEFAADLQIDDPEFEDWLRDMRLSQGDGAAPPAPSTPAGAAAILLSESTGATLDARMTADILIQEAAVAAAEVLGLPVLRAHATPHAPRPPGITVSASGSLVGARFMGQVALSDSGTGRILWSRLMQFRADALDELRHASVQLSIAVVDAARSASGTDHQLLLGDAFGFSRDGLMRADRALAAVAGASPGAVQIALRAFLRNTMFIERATATDPGQLLDEAGQFAAQSRALAPHHPLVLAVSAQVASWRRQPMLAHEMARLAAELYPESDMAQFALSQTLTDIGDHAGAHRAALQSGSGMLALLAPASWLMRRAMTEIRMGRLAAAQQAAEAAHGFAPESRPALRFMVALRYHRGDEGGAAEAAARLRLIEPGFTAERLLDPDYPAATLRVAGLTGVARAGL